MNTKTNQILQFPSFNPHNTGVFPTTKYGIKSLKILKGFSLNIKVHKRHAITIYKMYSTNNESMTIIQKQKEK